jgi:hypothetical protein
MVKKVSESGDYGLSPIIEPVPVEERLDRIEATLARILSHLDPAGTSVTLNQPVESEGQ